MENKSRTDMLAAGRKKLQQFRQKKDGKGSGNRGKSSKKSGKSDQHESDADTASSNSTSVASSKVTDAKAASNVGIIALTESEYKGTSETLDLNILSVDPSSVPTTCDNSLEKSEDVSNSGSLLQEQIATENNFVSSVSSEGKSSQSIGPNVSRILSLETSLPASIMDVESMSTETDSKDTEQEPLPSYAVIPDTSLMNAREDQVGTMQEADGSDSNQFSQSYNRETGDKRHTLSEAGEGTQSFSGVELVGTGIEKELSEVEETSEAVQGAKPAGETVSDGFSDSVSDIPPGGDIQTSGPYMTIQKNDLPSDGGSEMLVPSKDTMKEGVQEGREDRAVAEWHSQQLMPAESVSDENSHHVSTETQTVGSAGGLTVSPISDVSSFSLLQLREVISALNEEDSRFLLKSRQKFSCADPEGLDHSISENLGRLKEELYLSNLMKEVSSLQLSEHLKLQVEYDNLLRQLIEERSALHEKNQYLVKDLAHCHSELQDVSRKKEEMQSQLNIAKEEVEVVSARAHELQSSLESSQKETLNLSSGLADFKDLVRSLQEENESLNKTLASLTEERNRVLEEKELHMHENEKLSKEVAEFRGLLEALRVENSDLNGTLCSVTQQRQKLEEEIEHISHEIERLSVELANNKDLLSSLMVENASLSESLTFSVDQRNKLEENSQSVLLEKERLSLEVIALQEELSTEKGERFRFEVDLKEAKVRIDQLIEENAFLNSSLNLHKTKIEEISEKRSQVFSYPFDLGNQTFPAKEHCKDFGTVIDVFDSQHTSGKQWEKRAPGKLPLKLLEQEVFDDSLGFVSLMKSLEELARISQKLETAIDGMHSHSLSLGKSGSKMAAPVVSKLIQAFETKAPLEEQDVEEMYPAEIQQTDAFLIAKHQAANLAALLKQLNLDVENVDALFKSAQDDKKTGIAMYGKLNDQFEALKEHSNNIEASYIEFTVQYEFLKHYMFGIQENNRDLQNICEALRQENTCHRAEYHEICEKLMSYQSRVTSLHNQLSDIRHCKDEMAYGIFRHLENMQKEATGGILLLDEAWSSALARIVETIRKLEDLVGKNSVHEDLDSSSLVVSSVKDAITVIDGLQKKLEATCTDHEVIFNSYKDVNDKYNDLLEKNEKTVGILQKMCGDLGKLLTCSYGPLDEEGVNLLSKTLPDLENYGNFEILIKQFENILVEKTKLETENNELKSELMHITKELEELNKEHVDLYSLDKLVESVEGALEGEALRSEINQRPLSYLESLISFLVKKYREANEQIRLTREGYGSKVMELADNEENAHQLVTMCLHHENEILILKESLVQAEEALTFVHSHLTGKVRELEQSEQRVSSIREKLSMAVAKGKGLIVQRDGLKQSLAETSSELERCLQELQLKDARLLDVETKLKAYAEAGEHVEALESELSYIRNSATALRESFLLKDSVLQRIEEILEDLDMPEHFHSSDIIDKIGWLARSAANNSLPVHDWDQKSSAEGGAYSDAGFVVADGWKDDGHLRSNSMDDFRQKFEELQGKFYGLAEQNEILEQSLMERNNLVQKWEELLHKISMPSHLRSMETGHRLEWLGRALAEAQLERDSLQQKIDNFEKYCGLLTAEVEDSQRRASDLDVDLKAVTEEREHLSEKVETLTHEYQELSEKIMQADLENGELHIEVTHLQEKLVQKCCMEEDIVNKIRRLLNLVCDTLQVPGYEEMLSCADSIDCLEVSLKKLIESYTTLALMKPVVGGVTIEHQDEHCMLRDDATVGETRSINILDTAEQDIAILKKDLEDTLRELGHVKEERDRCLEMQRLLSGEVEVLSKKREELQELLSQEEQRSASVREKLNVAVRKGKTLMQQRDNLKQNIEPMNKEIENLKSDISSKETALADYAQKFKEFSTYPERVEALESELFFLRNNFAETEHLLQEREYTLSMLLSALGKIEVFGEVNTGDPIKKLELIGNKFPDLHSSVVSLEQESKKSKRASELLLAELNEVQERNDAFQEELSGAASELTILRRERDLAETAKLEALSHLENLSSIHSEELKDQLSKFMGLKSDISQVQKEFRDVTTLLADVSFKNLELIQNVEAGLESCLKPNSAENAVNVALKRGHDSILSRIREMKERFLSSDSWPEFNRLKSSDDNTAIQLFHFVQHQLQGFLMDIGTLEEYLLANSNSVQEEVNSLSKLVMAIQGEMTSQRELNDTMKRIMNRRDGELVALKRNITILYAACTSSVNEIENIKAEMVGNYLVSEDTGKKIEFASYADGEHTFGVQDQFFSEENIKTLADRLLSAVKVLTIMKSETLEANQKEMKITIANLQREIQEKDIQKDRMCMELVNQIKEAEAAAKTYSQDLQSSRGRVHDLEKQVDEIKGEKSVLMQRVNEMQIREEASSELLERIRSLTDLLASKDQEIEALMQALDEEEMQMEDLKNKVQELEKVVQQKNLDLDTLETSRSKVMKKLSITVKKFDELHHLSAGLLAEVEKLQSQLQDRDAEISFLRQEVSRCTNDVLVASQMSSKQKTEVFEFLTWFEKMAVQVGVHDVHAVENTNLQIDECKEILQKWVTSMFSELIDLRAVAHGKDALLQVERSKVEELTSKQESLEKSLREKDSRLNLLEGAEESGRETSLSPEILGVEPLMKKWTAPAASVVPQVRSLRKGNNEHVAIAIDTDPVGTATMEDEDDDKVHGFKSLTTSRIVPRFTRPVTDMIDGLWVSCDRALMRQPALRLGIIIYWAILHALLATFVV